MGTTSDQKEGYMQNGFSENGKTSALIPDMELREEWQDEEFPRPLPEDSHDPGEEAESSEADENRPAPPTSLALTGNSVRKKRLMAPTLSINLDKTSTDRSLKSEEFEASALSPSFDDDPEMDINLEALETPSDSESYNFPDSIHDLPKMGKAAIRKSSLLDQAEMGHLELDQVDSNGLRWRRFHIGGQDYQVNMSVLEPYLQVLSHGGYYGDGSTAIIMFTSCYLPENTTEHYEYVMDNLFRYIIGTLDLMVSENYILVYLCGMAPRNKMPGIKWLRQCYMSIDRRLRKDLKGLFVVHPAWYVRALITVIKPFISEKFGRKMRFIHSLQELAEFVPLDQLQIPECIREYDGQLNR
ncbi:bcl-2/adenovirus E1B 19 kDa-interacting protein 2-like protein isoform X2 [Misgurnus anguillicaudatus]|uniref:bcl-2/adenovirus E1B 19 kDa-interacting protein 2-like protein isoform X2 n=1 Tax=Misgurnus anguillicaudatus TaxID=75329 RepID=UPI002435D2E0|nr:bcl-2/adenovirus E1B 19 kDa-interacting protein 2-like protein isoform X2 [Misgurnus anguillicaudatus]